MSEINERADSASLRITGEARLHRAVRALATQSGTPAEPLIDWLCNGGLAQMALSHFAGLELVGEVTGEGARYECFVIPEVQWCVDSLPIGAKLFASGSGVDMPEARPIQAHEQPTSSRFFSANAPDAGAAPDDAPETPVRPHPREIAYAEGYKRAMEDAAEIAEGLNGWGFPPCPQCSEVAEHIAAVIRSDERIARVSHGSAVDQQLSQLEAVASAAQAHLDSSNNDDSAGDTWADLRVALDRYLENKERR